jgi:hypothetical protein
MRSLKIALVAATALGGAQPDRASGVGDAHQRACARRQRARNRRAASCVGLWAVSLLVAPGLGLWLSPLLGPAPVLGLAPPLVVSSPTSSRAGNCPLAHRLVARNLSQTES